VLLKRWMANHLDGLVGQTLERSPDKYMQVVISSHLRKFNSTHSTHPISITFLKLWVTSFSTSLIAMKVVNVFRTRFILSSIHRQISQFTSDTRETRLLNAWMADHHVDGLVAECSFRSLERGAKTIIGQYTTEDERKVLHMHPSDH
jgi:hypothetical protein